MVKDDHQAAIPWSKANDVDKLDTILPSGWYLDFEYAEPEDYMITWGSPDSGNIGKLPGVECWNDGCPYEYTCEFENYIGVRGSCGMALWSFFLLPKNKQDTIIRLTCDLQCDTNRGYILAKNCREDTCDFCFFDVNTLTHHPIKLEGLPPAGFISSLLDTIEFVDGGVRLKWNSTSDAGNVEGMRDTVINAHKP